MNLKALSNPVPDENGTISWEQGALMVALSESEEVKLIVDYIEDYWDLIDERVDLGELNLWISEHTMDAIAELIFPSKVGCTD